MSKPPPPLEDMPDTVRRCSTSCTSFSAATAPSGLVRFESTARRQDTGLLLPSKGVPSGCASLIPKAALRASPAANRRSGLSACGCPGGGRCRVCVHVPAC